MFRPRGGEGGGGGGDGGLMSSIKHGARFVQIFSGTWPEGRIKGIQKDSGCQLTFTHIILINNYIKRNNSYKARLLIAPLLKFTKVDREDFFFFFGDWKYCMYV